MKEQAALSLKHLGFIQLDKKYQSVSINALNQSLLLHFDEQVLQLFVEAGRKAKRYMQVGLTLEHVALQQTDNNMKYEYLNMARQAFEPDAIDLNCLINLALVCIKLKKLREASEYLMAVIPRCPS